MNLNMRKSFSERVRQAQSNVIEKGEEGTDHLQKAR